MQLKGRIWAMRCIAMTHIIICLKDFFAMIREINHNAVDVSNFLHNLIQNIIIIERSIIIVCCNGALSLS